MKDRFKMASGFIGMFFLVAVDQLTKHLAAANLKNQASFSIWKGVFELSYVENTGASFGILKGGKWFFIILTIMIIALLIYIFVKISALEQYRYMQRVLVVLLAGAAGNFIDRLRLNYVIDFFYFKLIDFPVFNVADIYVVMSVIAFGVLILFVYSEKELDVLTGVIFPRKK